MARHAGSSWEVCSRCEGAEYMDVHGVMERCDCVGGLTESADGELAEVLEFPAVDAEPGWVVTVPRNDDPAQLVPRGDVSAYVQAVLPVAGSPELEAAARANPTDPATGFAAFGACY
ncbi:hypothetical protein [Nocardia farcinica]|uniref:hypothetical protein n=1 Tax=Nocardia farcinica TaxID=37329 RepID=UPI001894951D|nr:hypothetical protein [Nocardia farcinica]MBF6251020.1 hypothetical protein [Nocardia farcinica]